MILHRYAPTDARLGRHVQHDPRSRDFAVETVAAPGPVSWTRRSPILNQGQVGSCTGNALTGLLGTDSRGRTAKGSVSVRQAKGPFAAGPALLDERFAVRAYTTNTLLDGLPGTYPPSDTGSSGLACGRTGKALGLFSGYRHAFGLAAVKSAIQHGPLLLGIPWYSSMFQPRPDGMLVVDPASDLAGGHEVVLAAWVAGRWRIDNSWGASWGDRGSAYLAEADLEHLLAERGDAVLPTYVASELTP